MNINNKEFYPFISSDEIIERVELIGSQISKDYSDKNPLFVAVLNGAFMFASDLMKCVNIRSEISFVKLASYQAMETTGNIQKMIGLKENLEGRHVVIIEDIVDTGNTMAFFVKALAKSHPASIEIATLLFKPQALKNHLNLKYVGFEIPSKFVVGYGLDYDGYGRNLKDIYQLKID